MLRRLERESLILVPGGAAEALHAHPGVMKFYFKRRKGFVRLALETQSHLIPVIGFGENDIFDTLNLSCSENANASFGLIWNIQRWLIKTTTFSLPILTRILPKRIPINVVVGEPVEFKSTNVEECHRLYQDAVQKLYDDHKAKFGYEGIELEII